MNKPIIAIDLDDTLCFYKEQYRRDLSNKVINYFKKVDKLKEYIKTLESFPEKDYKFKTTILNYKRDIESYIILINKIENYLEDNIKLKFTEWELRKQPYPQSHKSFFRKLQPIPGAIETIEKLKDIAEIHILTRPSNKNLHCYSEKAEWVFKYLGEDILNNLTITSHKNRYDADFLIDDVEWKEFKGIQLQFGTLGLETWDKVYEYLMKLIHRDYIYFTPQCFSEKSKLFIAKNSKPINLKHIEYDLIKESFEGFVVLDLLLITGINRNRYKLYHFDGKHLVYDGTHHANNSLQQASADFFQDNPELLTNEVLDNLAISQIKTYFNPRRKKGDPI